VNIIQCQNVRMLEWEVLPSDNRTLEDALHLSKEEADFTRLRTPIVSERAKAKAVHERKNLASSGFAFSRVEINIAAFISVQPLIEEAREERFQRCEGVERVTSLPNSRRRHCIARLRHLVRHWKGLECREQAASGEDARVEKFEVARLSHFLYSEA